MLFCDEDSVASYLGVHIDQRKDSTIRLNQKGLAYRIVETMHLNDKTVDPVNTPCIKYLLLDKLGSSDKGEFSYLIIVGQLKYLQGHSRSDITMTTSQCARYVHNSKRSHELTLTCIGRQLKETLDESLILKPIDAGSLRIDIYVGTAFAYGWGIELGANPDSVKSRTGYTIETANFPVI